jgi:hypothetical protein
MSRAASSAPVPPKQYPLPQYCQDLLQHELIDANEIRFDIPCSSFYSN